MQWGRFLFSFNGRITRKAYWLRFVLPIFFIDIAAAVITPPPAFAEVVVSLQLLSFWPVIAIGAKRCHDRNRSGWFQLIALIPFFGIFWLLIELGFLAGTTGPNSFGEDPTEFVPSHR